MTTRTLRRIAIACFVLGIAFMLIGTVLKLTGLGSEYRAPHDGRRTTATYYSGSQGACGDLVGHYAASKWYACGKRVLVKHHHKQVVVTILDRCQCAMDLSRSAFEKLAPTSQGVIRVRLYQKG